DRFGMVSICDFVAMEEMPLLPDGNVDLNALSKPGSNGAHLERNIVPPQNELEEKLVKIWEKILNIHPISAEDNFFELGGSSLQAVRIFAKIEKTFEKKMSLATPFQAPTIRQLAEIIQDEGWTPAWSSLVAIQPEGSKPPFFCMAPLASTVLIFANLARQLGKEQPFYGLEPLGLDGEKEPHDRVEDMAAHYIKEIRNFKPEGPYFVGGGCFGGTIAFEVAQQLVTSGEEVVLVILDTIWPPLTAEMIENPPENYPFMAERFEQIVSRNSLKYDFRGLLRMKLRELPRAFKMMIIKKFKPSYREERIERVTFTGNYKPANIQHVMDAHYKARLSYVTRVYPGRIILLQSPLGTKRESHLAWSELVSGGVDCHMVPGDHELLYEAPNVKVVAAKLRACLEEAQAGVVQNKSGFNKEAISLDK
ncbi:MAG: thioesterase domain-containing protein, partial [Calditrichaeota bacterium]|nr:thioesterase domain-containing protein [Calditrichota bacterium]